MKLFLLLLVLVNFLFADGYSLRLAQGKATAYDLGEIITGHIGHFSDDRRVYSLDAGYRLIASLYDAPVDVYVKSGLSDFTEGSKYADVYEATLYLKVYWNLSFLDNEARIGFGEGFSYTSAVLAVEKEDALAHEDNNSHFLNYLDISVDFDFGRLSRVRSLSQTYIGVLIKHRSGIYGLINNVRHGGSNYPSVYIEKNF